MEPTYQVTQQRRFSLYETELPEINSEQIAINIQNFLAKEQDLKFYIGKFQAKHSRFDLNEQTDIFDDLIRAIETTVCEIDKTRNSNFDIVKPVVARAWCALFNKGDSLDWHSHEDRYVYNTVYYPVSHDAAICLEDINSDGNILTIKPKKGSLLVMQGTVNHKVEEINDDSQRLIFACDFVYKTDGSLKYV